jgi:hypothetical protein
MNIEPNLVLNQTSFKFFVKMTKIKGFKNPKNWFKNSIEDFIKKIIIIRTKTKGSFETKNKKTLIYLVTSNIFRFIKKS